MTAVRSRLEITVEPLRSEFGRRIVRRNYRWLRQRGVSKDIARLVLDSTIRATTGDALHARLEDQGNAA